METLQESIDLLKSNKNLILTGAPGTGKTYLAKEIADKLCYNITNITKSIMDVDWTTYYKLVLSEDYFLNSKVFAQRLKVIQRMQDLFKTGKHFREFSDDERKYIAGTLGKNQTKQFGGDSWWFGHMGGSGNFAGAINSNNPKISEALDNIPLKGNITKQNYDSFVKNFKEAINGNMVGCASRLLAMKRPDFFVCINGENKKGLRKAFNDKKFDETFDYYWEFITQKVHQSEWYKNPTPEMDIEKEITEIRVAFLDSVYYGNDNAELTIIDNVSQYNPESKSNKIVSVQFHPSYDYTDFVEGLRPKKEIEESEIGFELKDGVFKEFCEKAKNNLNENYVFIIDEINRGEISKIFGELFFSIDPSYRGKTGAVKTHYSNMHEDENEVFYVPENVYIIGTMNDIDRSVESLDFAMRRRFTWKEITAKDSQIMFEGEDWKEEAVKRMDNLNNAIWNVEKQKGIQGLNSSYHIGAAYFKTNLPNYIEEEKWENLWKYHLKPLLFEYLRGMSEAEKKLDELEKAYNLKENSDENN